VNPFAYTDPLVGAVDGWMGGLPAFVRLLVWGAATGALSMGLYALLSPQRRLAELKEQVRAVRVQLNGYDGEFAGAMPLLRRQITLSLRHLGLTIGPALVAAAPMLAVLAWAAGRFAGVTLIAGAHRWLGGWEAPFLASALVSSVAVKVGFRIQ
jgi:hypothetical protein